MAHVQACYGTYCRCMFGPAYSKVNLFLCAPRVHNEESMDLNKVAAESYMPRMSITSAQAVRSYFSTLLEGVASRVHNNASNMAAVGVASKREALPSGHCCTGLFSG